MRKLLSLIFLLSLALPTIAQNSEHPLNHGDHEAQQKWVDSVYNSLSLKEKSKPNATSKEGFDL